MKKIILLFIFFFVLVFNVYAEFDDKWSKVLYDSIRFAEDINDVVVDIDNIKLALANGANPNWITSQNGTEKSILSHYVYRVSVSDDPNITEKGIEAIKMLFEHKAKLQYGDGTILFVPITDGEYKIVKILLENGASATFWPAYKIGSHITPIELTTDYGYEKIIELLVKYGAKRLSEKDAIQRQFIQAAAFGTISELKALIKKGADVNTPNRQGETALLKVLGNVFGYSADTYAKVMYLLGIGADVNLKGKGRSVTLPLHEAIYPSHYLFRYDKYKDIPRYAEKILYTKKVLQELIKRGAFVSAQDGLI